ncbi:MAG TPA: GNAT family N-acetyltransferase [Pseudomonadales bacterium]|nr:GNAT family N-acetyltransferase [Pseudomonadales bacterium]
MTYRDYDPNKDARAVRRIWKEVGWLHNEEQDGIYVDGLFNEADDALVATIDGQPECAVVGINGEIQYLEEKLPLGAVAGVTTSRISRKLGFAADLTAMLLARQAEAGMAVSALGMFDQGFYDRLGFGTGPYEHIIRFDPSTLTVGNSFRPPKRLKVSNYEEIYGALGNRRMRHGGVMLFSPHLIRADLGFTPDAFGLGYYDGANGSLSHFIWGMAKGEFGPYSIKAIAWQTPDQLLELLALLKSLGDQVAQVSMIEIGEIQLQDLLARPIRTRRATRNSPFASESQTLAYWQLRMLDVPACLARTHLNARTVRFNLALQDPVEEFIEEGANWRGVAGDYVVQLGEDSSAEEGTDRTLPTLNATVNAFSRMWFGVRPASSLAITDNLSADPALLETLDSTLRLPKPHVGLEF